jgi:hypothetical protein
MDERSVLSAVGKCSHCDARSEARHMNGFRLHSSYNPAGIEYRNNVITMSIRAAAKSAPKTCLDLARCLVWHRFARV